MSKKTRQPAPELSDSELAKLLEKIGQAIKEARRATTTIDDFVYEINIARSSLARLEAGGDVRLSTFLKVIYGLKIKPEEFFKEL